MDKHLQQFLSITIAVFFSINAFAQDIPDTLSTSYGEGADTYVCNDEKIGPDVPRGAANFLVVRNHEVRMRIVYLKFDIYDNPRFNRANEAFIGLYVKYAEKMAGESLELSVYGMTDDALDDWEDTLLTYNTAPGLEFADLADYYLDDSRTQYLTRIIIPKDSVGWVYSEPTTDMDEFINDLNEDNLLTFLILVEEPNGGDEVRFHSKEQTDPFVPPILHGAEPISNVESKSLSSVHMEQNFPNPFIGSTTLTYNLKEPNHVELTMYNMLGVKVATLVNEFQVTGVYNVNVNVDRMQLSPGIYYAKIKVGLDSQTIKMIICE
jgi:hypothetical protein